MSMLLTLPLGLMFAGGPTTCRDNLLAYQLEPDGSGGLIYHPKNEPSPCHGVVPILGAEPLTVTDGIVTLTWQIQRNSIDRVVWQPGVTGPRPITYTTDTMGEPGVEVQCETWSEPLHVGWALTDLVTPGGSVTLAVEESTLFGIAPCTEIHSASATVTVADP